MSQQKKEHVSVTEVIAKDKDIIVSFSDTLRQILYERFEKLISEICEGFKIIFVWRTGFDSVRIHLPKNALQDIVCTIKNFLQKFSFAVAT
jgi:hypothetical protein